MYIKMEKMKQSEDMSTVNYQRLIMTSFTILTSALVIPKTRKIMNALYMMNKKLNWLQFHAKTIVAYEYSIGS